MEETGGVPFLKEVISGKGFRGSRCRSQFRTVLTQYGARLLDEKMDAGLIAFCVPLREKPGHEQFPHNADPAAAGIADERRWIFRIETVPYRTERGHYIEREADEEKKVQDMSSPKIHCTLFLTYKKSRMQPSHDIFFNKFTSQRAFFLRGSSFFRL